MQRVGHLGSEDGITDRYLALGERLFRMTHDAARRHLDLAGAAVLDLGCGAGRVTRHWIRDDGTLGEVARVVGADVDRRSIDWLNEHLGPAITGIVNASRPPLPFDDASFDVVVALSLFTHLDIWWAEWIAEVHRLLRPGGVAVVTILEAEQMRPIFGCESNGTEGMVALASGRPWDVGGPVVFHGRWWIDEHWGRGFEVTIDDVAETVTEGGPAMQTTVTLRRRSGPPLAPSTFESAGVDDVRERLAGRRAREIRETVHGGPSAFGPTHRLAPLIRQFIEDSDPALAATGLEIAAADDMYRFGLAVHQSPTEVARAYFAVGLETLSVVDRIVDWHFGAWRDVASLLDFAAGYGRITRFLVHRVPAERVTVGEIQHDALRFQSINFGVETVSASVHDVDLAPERRFDMVLVVSLFTHLPRETWIPWLARLWDRTAPGGLLVFTTHNSDRRPPLGASEEGFWFDASSEIPNLDPDQYGSTFVSDVFVRSAIAEVCGASADTTQRLVRAIGDQDVYVVVRAESVDSPLTVSEHWPAGAVDEAVRLSDGKIRITGWAGGDVEPPERVEVSVAIGSSTFDVVSGLPRPDVAAAKGRPWDLDLHFAGWQVDIPDPLEPSDDQLTIAVVHGGARVDLLDEPARQAVSRLLR